MRIAWHSTRLCLLALLCQYCNSFTHSNSFPPFPSGEVFGDSIYKCDDCASDRFPFGGNGGFRFFGGTYRYVWANNNGRLTFGVARPNDFAQPTPPSGVAAAMPWATDAKYVQAAPTSELRVRNVALDSATVCQAARALALGHFVDAASFAPVSALLATWSDMGCYGCQSKKSSWQSLMVADDDRTYVINLYGRLTWPVEGESGDDGSSANRIPFIGFIAGNNASFYEAAGSRTVVGAHAMENGSNVGTPGVWIYRVDGATVIDEGLVPSSADPPTCLPLPFDECEVDNPGCVNGVCVDTDLNSLDSTLSCECFRGYEGVLCQTDLDDCRVHEPPACENYAECIDDDFSVENSAACDCSPFFTGRLCDTDVNECESEWACAGNFVCENLFGSFRCVEVCATAACEPGWTGDRCDIDVDECAAGVCSHAEFCVNEPGGFECECWNGWGGATCSVPDYQFGERVEVDTASGRVRGVERDHPGTGERLRIYRGIPFARPPVGEHRFRRAQPIEPWSGVFEAVEFGPACPQLANFGNHFSPWIRQDEDCLYLNIYAPAESASPSGGYPVLFHIVGLAGQNLDGSWLLDAGAYFANNAKVVYVTFNYRLGVFGFYQDEDSAETNNALSDQVLALEFVFQNAQLFGGDPSNIVVLGSDYVSSVAVDLLRVSPESRHMVNRCVKMSGGWRDPHAFGDTAAPSRLVDERLGCVEQCCARLARSVEQILAAAASIPATGLRFPFSYDDDDDFHLRNGGVDALASQPSVSCMTIFHESESALFGASGRTLRLGDPFGMSPTDDAAVSALLDVIADSSLTFKMPVDAGDARPTTALRQLVHHFYWDQKNKRRDHIVSARRSRIRVCTRALNDFNFYMPAMDALFDEHYGMAREGEPAQYVMLDGAGHEDDWADDAVIAGSTHFNMLDHMFGRPFTVQYSSRQQHTTASKIVQKFLAQFLHYGEPWLAATKRVAPKTKPFKRTTTIKQRPFFLLDEKRASKMKKFFANSVYKLYKWVLPQVGNAAAANGDVAESTMRRLKRQVDKYLKSARKFGPWL